MTGSIQIDTTSASTSPDVIASTTWDDDTTPVYAITSAVADATGTDICSLTPLAEAIDPDALNNLFTSRPTPSVDQISFQYAGYTVVVQANGTVDVRSSRSV